MGFSSGSKPDGETRDGHGERKTAVAVGFEQRAGVVGAGRFAVVGPCV